MLQLKKLNDRGMSFVGLVTAGLISVTVLGLASGAVSKLLNVGVSVNENQDFQHLVFELKQALASRSQCQGTGLIGRPIDLATDFTSSDIPESLRLRTGEILEAGGRYGKVEITRLAITS